MKAAATTAGLTALLVCMLLSSCQSTPGESESLPEPLSATVLPQISDPLVAALRIAGFAQTPDQYVQLSIEVAQAQLDRNSQFQVLQTITFIERLLHTMSDPSKRVPLECELALLKIDIGQHREALLLLESTVGNISYIESDADRAMLLSKIIAAALRLDAEESQSVQRAALDQLLIVRETGIRAEALTQVADFYRSSDFNASAAPLLNQAIPAALSIPNPWLRARTLLQTLALFTAIGDERPARSHIRRILQVLQANPALNSVDRAAGTSAAAIAASVGYIDAAIKIAELLESPSSQIASLIAIADQLQGSTPQRAAQLRARTNRELASLGDNSRRARLALALANSYLRDDNLGSARQLADEVRSLLTDLRTGRSAMLEEIYADLSLLYFDLGAIDDAIRLARAEELGSGVLAPLRVAERAYVDGRKVVARELALLARQRLIEEQNRTLLQPPLAEQQTPQQEPQPINENPEQLLQLIALLVQLDEIESALQLIEPLDDTLELTRALIVVGRQAGPPFLLSERAQRLISALAATIPAR